MKPLHLLLSFSTLCLPSALAGQQHFDQVLPASSRVVLQQAGLSGFRVASQEHELARLLRGIVKGLPAEQRERIFRQLHGRVGPQLKRGLQRVGLSLVSLRQVLRREAAIAVGRPTLSSGMMIPSVLLALRTKGVGDPLLEGITRYLPKNRERIRIAGVHCLRHELGRPELDELLIHAGPDWLLLSNSRGFLAESLRAAQGKGEQLRDNAGYRAARGQRQDRALATVYVDVGQSLKALDPFLPYEADELGDQLGLSRLQGFTAWLSCADGRGVQGLHLAWPGKMSGVVRAAFQRPFPAAHARYLPENTVGLLSLNLDPAAAGKAVEDFVGRMPEWLSTEIQKQVGRELRRVRQQPDVRRLLGVLRGLRGDLTLALSQAKGGVPLPEGTVVLGLQQGSEIPALLEQVLEQHAPEGASSMQYQGKRIVYTSFKLSDLGEISLNLSPAFAVHDDKLVIASHPQLVKRALRMASQDGKGSFAQTEGFQDFMKHNGGRQAAWLLRAGHLVDVAYGNVEVRRALGQELGKLGLDLDLLPEGPQMRQAVGDFSGGLQVDAQGFSISSRSSVGIASQAVLIGYLIDEALRSLIGRQI